ncbi:hypothetical protein [Cohnella nanjingensis]|uniref:Uncharacterized protein n=1 Tax=Cohnella nanjingensis TaxID=1387779 RepID=A0A7X0RZW1_9BACL|nr:hypothetical protein [Cohnella nanjingensis]MBB6675124.1 hypothetical protein [Cohnella nanjingensis]
MTAAKWIGTAAFAVFISSLASALLLSLFFFDNLAAIFIVVLYCFVGTAAFGAPVSLLIFFAVRTDRTWGIMLRFGLHLAAGFVPLYLLSGSDGTIFAISGLVNAINYYVVFVLLRKCWKNIE